MDVQLLSVAISITISILAFLVSLISLWKSSLTPFNLKVSYSSPTFTLYKITPSMSGGEKTWWIPSINMGFTFRNLGKCCGEVTDIRIKGSLSGEIPDIRMVQNQEIKNHQRKCTFYAKWIVDYPKFEPIRHSRFEWITSSVIRDWYPLILAGDEEKSLHIIFEGGRWDEKYTGNLSLALEIFSSKEEKWIECDKYEQLITKDMYEKGESYILSNPKLRKIRGDFFEEWSMFTPRNKEND